MFISHQLQCSWKLSLRTKFPGGIQYPNDGRTSFTTTGGGAVHSTNTAADFLTYRERKIRPLKFLAGSRPVVRANVAVTCTSSPTITLIGTRKALFVRFLSVIWQTTLFDRFCTVAVPAPVLLFAEVFH